MKKYLYVVIVLFSISLSVNAQSAAEEEVAQAVEKFRKGIVDADKNLLESIAADDLVYGHSNGKVQNKKEFVAEIVSAQPIDYLTVELSGQTIRISGQTAVVRHVFTSRISANGKPGNLKIGNMLIWQKQRGKWKLLARQAYKI